MKKLIEKKLPFDVQYYLSRLILITLGTATAAFAVSLFLVPANIAAGGITGLGIILNELTSIPVGVVVALANIPILILGFLILKGWKTLLMTAYALGLYSLLLVVLPGILPENGITDERMLNALFGGVAGGIGGGIVYRAGGTMGGTSTIARILRFKKGISLSSASLYSDTFILIGAGVVFGWEAALYATVSLFVTRLASDYLLEGGSGNTLTAFIVTDSADEVRQAVAEYFGHDITSWRARGSHKDQEHRVLLLTLRRSEVSGLRKLLRSIDASSFLTVLKGQATFGKGFTPFQPHMPLALDEVEDDGFDGRGRISGSTSSGM